MQIQTCVHTHAYIRSVIGNVKCCTQFFGLFFFTEGNLEALPYLHTDLHFFLQQWDSIPCERRIMLCLPILYYETFGLLLIMGSPQEQNLSFHHQEHTLS